MRHCMEPFLARLPRLSKLYTMSPEATEALADRVACLEGARGAGSPLLPFLLGCLVAAATLAALAATYMRRHQLRVQLLTAAHLAAADEGHVRRLLGEALPAW